MRSRFPGFSTVRATCRQCGWYRILGYTGANGGVRALIRVERANNPCNVLWAKVITVSADQDLAELADRYPKYRDLQWAWNFRRAGHELQEAKRPYWEIVKDQSCPRCKRSGGVFLEVYTEYPEGCTMHAGCWL